MEGPEVEGPEVGGPEVGGPEVGGPVNLILDPRDPASGLFWHSFVTKQETVILRVVKAESSRHAGPP